MTHRKIALLGLMELVRTNALPEDWNNQRAKGERKRAFSRSAFDDAMYDNRPEIGTSTWFKKIYNYTHHNETIKVERGVSDAEVLAFLHYIYKDIPASDGWPAIEAAFRDYQGGEFSDLIAPYKSIARNDAPEAVDAYAESLHIRMITMAIEAKARYEEKNRQLMSKDQENKALRKAMQDKESALQMLSEKIALLERLLDVKKGDSR